MISDLPMLELMILVIIYMFFDIKYLQSLTALQPIELEFEFDGVVPNYVKGYTSVLTNKLVSVSSDGQREFDLIDVIINFFAAMILFPC